MSDDRPVIDHEHRPDKEYSPWVAIRSKLPSSPRADILSGLTVALALIPEAVAFAFVAGVDPMIGLYSAFVMCLLTAILGGRPGMISGATGAMAVIVIALVATHGVVYLFPAVILCGIFQIIIGLLRLGKLIRMVPHSVMLGFVNGLAIVIGMAQLGSFKSLGDDGMLHYITGLPMLLMLALVGLTMAIIFFLPKLTKLVPSSLAGIVVVTLIAIGINTWGPKTDDGKPMLLTVQDMVVDGKRAKEVTDAAKAKAEVPAQEAQAILAGAGLEQLGEKIHTQVVQDPGTLKKEIKALSPDEINAAVAKVEDGDGLSRELPLPFFIDAKYADLAPPIAMDTLWSDLWKIFIIILPFSLVLAGVGLIESLMTLSLVDELTETRGRGNRECIGQGVANMTSGFFGGMGGCAMIGQSLINVKSGGKNRLSGITAAVFMLALVLVATPVIQMIPMAALVGVMFMVVIGTFEWATLRTWHKIPFMDVVVMVFVAGYTVLMHDLATAVILGVVISALVFAWRKSTHLTADKKTNDKGQLTYQIHGPLFFASVTSFKDLFNSAEDPDDVYIDFYYTRVYDQSGLEAINFIADKYSTQGKKVHLVHLSEECQKLLGKAGDLVEANISEDPHYHVASDKLA